jgi:2-amino-4-hydroxy-6-hydroxymethyldihydropteridine diphosphokinase
MTTSARRPAYIGLGSNLDHPSRQVETAIDCLAELPETTLEARSGLYRSAPFGGVEQADFVNAAAGLLTGLSARELLAELKAIERRRGREPGGVRWGPRVLDLDLLVFDDETIDEPELAVPHPGIADRNFVLLPLRDIAPDLEIPGLGRVSDIPVNSREPRIERIV